MNKTIILKVYMHTQVYTFIKILYTGINCLHSSNVEIKKK